MNAELTEDVIRQLHAMAREELLDWISEQYRSRRIARTSDAPKGGPMNVRAKFKVTQVIDTQYSPMHSQKKIVLEPQYDSKVAEDVSFSKATPSGRIEMQIDNPAAIAAMPIGTTFYVDFIPVEVSTNQPVPA